MPILVRLAGWLTVVRFVASGHLVAQAAEPLNCHYSETGPGVTEAKSFAGGFTARIGASADSSAAERTCHVELLDPNGAVVWRAEGFGARIDSWSGRDVDGDGWPEVVLGVEEGGGNRGYWRYAILTMADRVRPRAELDFTPIFVVDPNGRGTLLVELQVFWGLGPSMADSPTAVRIHRLMARGMVEVTSDRCAYLLQEGPASSLAEWRAPIPSPEDRTASRRAVTSSYPVEQTRVLAMSRILQLLICRRSDEGRQLADQTWPSAEAAAVFDRLVAASHR